MIVDTSVIVACLREEPETRLFMAHLGGAASKLMSAGSHVELTVVIARSLSVEAFDKADQLLRYFAIAIEPVTVEHARLAREGFCKFGQGSGHPARLNFGDCFAYALAKATSEPLLFKGDDFIHTDVKRAA